MKCLWGKIIKVSGSNPFLNLNALAVSIPYLLATVKTLVIT